MNSEQRFPINLDFVAGLITGFLLLAILLVIGLGAQLGIRVTAVLPVDAGIGPLETLVLHFSEPVDGGLTIKNFSIQPAVNGKVLFPDTKTLQFVPREPFQPDATYTLTLASGALTLKGDLLKKSKSWNLHVRPPLIVYMVTSKDKNQLWTVDPDLGKSTPLTDDTFKIFDFDASRNGEFVIFSAFNEQQGIDLWRVERAGTKPVMVLQCSGDRCSAPAISPDGQRVAYVREAGRPTPDVPYGSPRIWMLNLQTGQDASLYEDQQIIGFGPVWSPDGTRLSSYNALTDEIRLLDLVTSNQLIISSQTGIPVSWSADGSDFTYTDFGTNDYGTHTRIREAKLSTQEITTMFGENDEIDYHYNSLAWSPTGNMLVIGLRLKDNDPADALWLVDPSTQGGQVIVDQPDTIYNDPIWDPWGKALVFQQFKLKQTYKSEIGLWMPGAEQSRILAEGIMPHWLP